MFGSNHLYVLHHPHDPDMLKKKAEAKKKGEVAEESAPTYETAQEEIAKNSGFYGGLQASGKSSKGMLNSLQLIWISNNTISCCIV